MPDLHNYEDALSNDVVAGSSGSISVTLGAGAASFAAPKGSLYLNVAGTTTNDRLYSCSVATGTWVAVTTAS